MAHREPPTPDEIEPEQPCVICGNLTDNFIDGQPICLDCYDAKLEAEGQPVAEEDEEGVEPDEDDEPGFLGDTESFKVEDEDDGHRKADS